MLASPDETVVASTLQLLCTLLEDGHTECQLAILDYFKNSPEELFFMLVKEKLQVSVIVVKEVRSLAQTKEMKFQKEKEIASTSRNTREHKRSTQRGTVGEGDSINGSVNIRGTFLLFFSLVQHKFVSQNLKKKKKKKR